MEGPIREPYLQDLLVARLRSALLLQILGFILSRTAGRGAPGTGGSPAGEGKLSAHTGSSFFSLHSLASGGRKKIHFVI